MATAVATAATAAEMVVAEISIDRQGVGRQQPARPIPVVAEQQLGLLQQCRGLLRRSKAGLGTEKSSQNRPRHLRFFLLHCCCGLGFGRGRRDQGGGIAASFSMRRSPVRPVISMLSGESLSMVSAAVCHKPARR